MNGKKLSEVRYLGELRTEATHLASGRAVITDAPVDNKGRGEAFSPTDLVATALATCMFTVMGIRACSQGFDLEQASAEVIKVMVSNPRKISEIHIALRLKQNCDDHTRKILEDVALNCPVAKSLHPGILQNVTFEWIV